MTDQMQPAAPTDQHRYAPTSAPFASGPVPPTPYGYGYGPAPTPSGLGDGSWPLHHGGGYPGVDPRGGDGGRSRIGWIVGGAVLLVLVLLGGVASVFLMLGDPSPAAPPPVPAVVPAAPPAAPVVPAAPAPSSPGSGATTGSASSGRTLSTVFTDSTGPHCSPYTPTAGEYETSRGNQATEVRVCAPDAQSGVVFTSWASAADAASVVSDQASFPSSDGKTTWTMGGTAQGDWHERRLDDGSCMAALDYSDKPYSVLITAPTCSAVGTLFQQTALPDVTAVPAR